MPAAFPPSEVAAHGGESSVSPPPVPATGPISATGPLHRILEGTVIDTVLTNRLEGSVVAPVNCLVTNAVYARAPYDRHPNRDTTNATDRFLGSVADKSLLMWTMSRDGDGYVAAATVALRTS